MGVAVDAVIGQWDHEEFELDPGSRVPKKSPYGQRIQLYMYRPVRPSRLLRGVFV